MAGACEECGEGEEKEEEKAACGCGVFDEWRAWRGTGVKIHTKNTGRLNSFACLYLRELFVLRG
jgi:hypothetical protein